MSQQQLGYDKAWLQHCTHITKVTNSTVTRLCNATYDCIVFDAGVPGAVLIICRPIDETARVVSSVQQDTSRM